MKFLDQFELALGVFQSRLVVAGVNGIFTQKLKPGGLGKRRIVGSAEFDSFARPAICFSVERVMLVAAGEKSVDEEWEEHSG